LFRQPPSAIFTMCRRRLRTDLILEAISPAAEVASLPFVKNSFVVLASTLRRDVDRGVEQLGRSVGKSDLFPESAGRISSFRAMIHIDGKLSSVARNLRIPSRRRLPAGRGPRPGSIARFPADASDDVLLARGSRTHQSGLSRKQSPCHVEKTQFADFLVHVKEMWP